LGEVMLYSKKSIVKLRLLNRMVVSKIFFWESKLLSMLKEFMR
jgi:hypothetical protein